MFPHLVEQSSANFAKMLSRFRANKLDLESLESPETLDSIRLTNAKVLSCFRSNSIDLETLESLELITYSQLLF